MTSRPTKERVREVMREVEGDNVVEGYWQVVHERLGLPYGEAFDIITKDPEFFGLTYRDLGNV